MGLKIIIIVSSVKYVCKSILIKSFQFYPEERESNKILEVVSTYTCGPINSVAFDGVKYFESFEDQFLNFVIVYPKKAKSEVFEKFTTYKTMATLKFGVEIYQLSCDGGE